MNSRDKLKEQKKRLRHYPDSNLDVTSVGNVLERVSFFTTYGMLRENPIGTILPILQNTKRHYYHSLKRTPSNFYYSVRHTTTLLSGVRRSRMRPCGSDSVRLEGCHNE